MSHVACRVLRVACCMLLGRKASLYTHAIHSHVGDLVSVLKVLELNKNVGIAGGLVATVRACARDDGLAIQAAGRGQVSRFLLGPVGRAPCELQRGHWQIRQQQHKRRRSRAPTERSIQVGLASSRNGWRGTWLVRQQPTEPSRGWFRDGASYHTTDSTPVQCVVHGLFERYVRPSTTDTKDDFAMGRRETRQ